MDCTQIRQQLDAYEDGELDAIRARELETHLLGCPDCLRAEERLTELRSAVRKHATYHSAPAELREAHVVEQEHEDVGSAFARARWLRPRGVRGRRRAADAARERRPFTIELEILHVSLRGDYQRPSEAGGLFFRPMYPGQVYSSNRCPAPIDTSLTLERALGRLLAVPIKPIAEPRLYQRIAGELARLIDDGTFAAGARLPAERAQLLGVNLGLVYDELDQSASARKFSCQSE